MKLSYLNPEISFIMLFRKKTIFLFISLLFSLYVIAQPTISSFSPVSGSVGTSVTITGNNFSTTPANNIVFFGAVKANVTAATASSLTVTVPAGTTYQPITVTTGGLTGYSARPFVVTFSGGGQINSSSFSARTDFITDLHPNGIVIADLDGDSKPDLATPNNYSTSGQPASISILRNISTGAAIAFAPVQNINNGVLTYALASGDIDGDGKQDLVACSIADLNISVFRNTSVIGSISFAPKIDYTTNSGTHGITISDIDGDGKPDISVVNYINGIMSVYRNTGSPGVVSFAPKIDFATSIGPESITSADFDGDGKADIAVTNSLINSFSLFRNTSTPGNISFSARADINCGGSNQPFGISAGDLDGDSKIDLVIVTTNSSLCGAQLYRNTSTSGSIIFNYITTLTGASNATSYHSALGDVNGDGKPDIALTTNVSPSQTKVYQNNSTSGSITFGTGYGFASIFGPYAVSFCDLDADSRPELAVSAFTLDKVSAFKNKCGSPEVLSFSPSSATSGATVTITGSNFTGITGVSFGGIAATSFSVINTTTINAVVGSGASGDVVVTNSIGPGGKSGFQFAGPPVLTSFTPTSGFSATTVTISGFNFNGATAVSFGGIAATSVNIVDPFTILATVGTGATGNVSVTTAFGTGSLAGFTYAPVPIINSFTPTSAATGSTVTISGINFTGTTSVSFGGITASSFTVVNENTITATVGNGASGNVAVTNTFGTSTIPGFTYRPPPTISSFNPLAAGQGTTVVITGTNFNNVSVLKFGGTDASSFTVINSTTINAIVSSGSSGAISITASGGTASLAGFTFIPVPTITSFFPATTGTGATVTITGTNFTGASVVSFGVIAASSFTVVNPTTITAVVGNGATGNIVVTTPGGIASSVGFSYTTLPVINSVSPLVGPVGATVTITGASFAGGVSNNVVYFGGVRASVISVSPNVLTVTVPVGATNKPITVTSLSSSLTAVSEYSFKITFPGGTNAFDANSFAGQMNFDVGIGPGDIDLGDIDGDGKLDILVTSYGSPFISIFRNISTPGQLAFAERIDINLGLYANNTVIADMNGDGKLDLILAKLYYPLTGGNSDILILTNNSSSGSIAFNAPQTFFTFDIVAQIAVGDLNYDGRPDIAGICNNCGIDVGGIVTIFTNNSIGGNLSFTDSHGGFSSNVSGVLMNGIEIKDLNRDNRPELMIGTNSDAFVIFPVSNFTGQQIIGSFSSSGSFSNIEFTDDLDADGKIDILTTNWININNSAFLTGNYNITRQQNFSVGKGLTTDLNGDGKPDILTQGQGTQDKISILKNLSTPGNVSFAAVFRYPASNTAMKLDAGDLDGDGKPEICSANSGLNNISIYRNRIGESAAAPPTISSFTPASAGYFAQVTITGTNFNQATSVTFGNISASFFTVVSPTTIIAKVGNGASGSVSVTTPGGTASLAGFSFIPTPPPLITSFTPASGGLGAIITISGNNLNNASAVSFGGQSALNFVVASSTIITATVGYGNSGNVSVTTPGGTVSLAGFTYIQPPAIGSISPLTGGNGVTVTITGNNFTGATAVSFGGVAASSFTVVNANTITAIVGAGASGNVSVTTSGGTVTRNGFTFIPPPVILSFTPTNGTTGATITITGTNFTGATTVSFGGVAASSFTVVNATTITAVIGTGASGNISVTTPGGTATLSGFTYNIVTSVSNPGSNNSKELTVNPNPGNGLVLIKHPVSIKNAQIRFIDMLGRVVREIVPVRNANQTNTDVSKLPQGIYKIIWGDGGRILSRTFMMK